jgi:hypothetical protein
VTVSGATSAAGRRAREGRGRAGFLRAGAGATCSTSSSGDNRLPPASVQRRSVFQSDGQPDDRIRIHQGQSPGRIRESIHGERWHLPLEVSGSAAARRPPSGLCEARRATAKDQANADSSETTPRASQVFRKAGIMRALRGASPYATTAGSKRQSGVHVRRVRSIKSKVDNHANDCHGPPGHVHRSNQRGTQNTAAAY